jgi:hypothetical protein
LRSFDIVVAGVELAAVQKKADRVEKNTRWNRVLEDSGGNGASLDDDSSGAKASGDSPGARKQMNGKALRAASSHTCTDSK